MAKNAIITGASSGIGAALAQELSRRGWSLALLARRAELLDDVQSKLQGKAVTIPCDVTDAAAVERAARRGEAELGGAFDLAIANAGVSIPGHATKFKLEDAARTIRVNVLGMMNLFAAVIPSMVERRTGRFAGVASLAGLRALPTAASYSASKAAMQTFLEASRIELGPWGVGVTIINPGFVATPMTEKNKFRMPLLKTAEDSATIIADGLERGKGVIAFPLPMSLLMRLVRVVPDVIWDRATAPYSRRKVDPTKVQR